LRLVLGEKQDAAFARRLAGVLAHRGNDVVFRVVMDGLGRVQP
jgi:hypothetical protein